MHGTGMWLGSFLPLNLGGSVVTTSALGFDPHHLWAEVIRTQSTSITIVGDAFAKPMLDALVEARDTEILMTLARSILLFPVESCGAKKLKTVY